ncbi:F-box/WD repeat-containing protein 4 isoform X2 [Eretmochelys imbricata]
MGRKGSPRAPQAEGGCGAARPSLLWALPEELLLLICSYLDARALGRLGQVCRRLRAFAGRDPLWRRIARGCLNSGFTRLGADLAAGIPVKERVKVSQNWRRGRCRRETLLKWKRNLMPWMHLDGEYLYLSQAEDIRAYRFRPDSAGLQRHPQAIFSGHQEDVCRFVLASSHIVSGGGDGNIVLSKVHSSFSIKFSAHEQEVNCVDCQGGIIVSGSRDRTAKVWSLSSGRAGHCLHTVQTEDRVWSIAISPLLSYSSELNPAPEHAVEDLGLSLFSRGCQGVVYSNECRSCSLFQSTDQRLCASHFREGEMMIDSEKLNLCPMNLHTGLAVNCHVYVLLSWP